MSDHGTRKRMISSTKPPISLQYVHVFINLLLQYTSTPWIFNQKFPLLCKISILNNLLCSWVTCASLSIMKAQHIRLSFPNLCVTTSQGYSRGWGELRLRLWKKKSMCHTFPDARGKLEDSAGEQTVYCRQLQSMAWLNVESEVLCTFSCLWQRAGSNRRTAGPRDSGPECTKTNIQGSSALGSMKKNVMPRENRKVDLIR